MKTGGFYKGILEGNAPSGLGDYITNDESYYSGRIVNGMAHGEGFCIDKSGICYKGGFSLNSPHGKGCLKWEDISVEGIWSQG